MIQSVNPSSAMILGLGNVLLSDEGFGVHIVHRLQQAGLPHCVRVEEGGVGGLNLLGLLEGISHLLVIDVMMLPSAPGVIKLIAPDSPPAEPGKSVMSFHQVGILEVLTLSGLIGCRPETSFLVTRPQVMEWGTRLSPALEASVDKAIDVTRQWCRQLPGKEVR
jgi:hydrogenase maturation protease